MDADGLASGYSSLPEPVTTPTRPRSTSERMQGKGRRYWATSAWAFAWQIVLVLAAAFGRSPYHALALPFSVLLPRCAVIGDGLRSARLPKMAVVIFSLLSSTFRLIAAAFLNLLAVAADKNYKTDGAEYFEAFGIFDAETQTITFFGNMIADIVTIVLAVIYLGPMIGVRALDAPKALEKLALHRGGMQGILATSLGLGAFSLPALRSVPLLVMHFMVVGAFALRADRMAKWKVLHGVSQFASIYCTLLLLVDLGWQNAATRDVDMPKVFNLEYVSWTEEAGNGIRAALLLTRGLSLCGAIWSGRRLHGAWGVLSDHGALAIARLCQGERRKSDGARSSHLHRLTRWCKQTFPLLLLPAMVFVAVFIARNVATLILVLVTCFGFIADVDTFVKGLPPLYVFLAAIISASYAAAVGSTLLLDAVQATGDEITDTVTETAWQFTQLGIITVCGAAWIVAFKLRKVRINRGCMTRRQRRNLVDRALQKIGPGLPAVEEQYCKLCGEDSPVIKRAPLYVALHELMGERPTSADVDQTWEFFTRRATATRVHNSVAALARAMDTWEKQDSESSGEEDSDSDEPPTGETTPQLPATSAPQSPLAPLREQQPSDMLKEMEEGGQAAHTATLAELMLQHEDATVRRTADLGHRSEIVLGATTLHFGGRAVFSSYPGGAAADATAITDAAIATPTSAAPIVGLTFSDFVILSGAVVTHRMHNHHWAYAGTHLVGQLVLRNTTALTLLFMFAAATYGTVFDVLRMGLIALFVVFLCSATLRRRYWPVVIYYVAVMIVLQFAFRVVYRNEGEVPGKIGLASADELGLRLVSRVELLLNFGLLALAVMELRVFLALQNDVSVSRVLHEMEWRRMANVPGTVALQARLALLVAGACFVVVGLVEPNSALVAGFLMIFGLVIVVGQRVPSVNNGLWMLSTAYSVLALTAVSLYQFRGVAQWAMKLIDGDLCRDAGKNAETCAAELGLSQASANKPLVRVLLPWFIACTSNVVQLSLRLQTTFSEGDLSFNAYYTSQPLQLLLRFMAFSALVARFVRSEFAVHGAKIAWVGLIVASTGTINLSAAPYAVLLIFDQRGPLVLIASVLHMAVAYIYPLFFVPSLPGYSAAWQDYAGIHKEIREGSLASPVTAFGCCVVYMATVSQSRKLTENAREAAAAEFETARTQQKGQALAEAKLMSQRVRRRHRQSNPAASGSFTVEMSSVLSDHSGSANASMHEPPSFGCQFCTMPLCKGACDVGCKLRSTVEGQMSFTDRALQLWATIRLSLFDTMGAEIIQLFLLCSIAFTAARVTAAVFFLSLVIIWAGGRFRLMATRLLPLVLMFLCSTLFVWLMLASVNLAPAGDVSRDGPFAAQCSDWWGYMGCRVPRVDVVLAAISVVLFRMCHLRAPTRVLRWRYCGSFPTLSGYLKAHAQAIEDLLCFKRSDIANVLPPAPARDFLADPKRFDERIVATFIAFFPVSVAAFFHGALASNVVNVVEMLLGLSMIVYARKLYWRFPRFWPAVLGFFYFTLLLQLVANLPPVVAFTLREPDVGRSLGILPWASSGTSSLAVAVRIVVVWLAILQHRVFQERFFALKLAALYQGSVVAIRRHYEVLDCMNRRAEQSAATVRDREEKLEEKLNAIRASRRKITVTVVPDDGGDEAAEAGVAGDTVATSEANARDDELLSPRTRGPTMEKVREALRALSSHGSVSSGGSDRMETDRDSNASGVVENEAADAAEEEADEGNKTATQRLASTIGAVNGWFNSIADDLILWMAEQSYRGHVPPSHFPRPQRLALAAWNFVLRRTMELCLFVFATNFVASGTLCDMMFCLVALAYAFVLLPWPSERFWDGLLAANAFGIFVKSALRIAVENVDVTLDTRRFIAVTFLDLGLNGGVSPESAAFVDIVFDFAVFGSILLHKQVCLDSGVYASEYATTDEALKAAARTVTRDDIDVSDSMRLTATLDAAASLSVPTLVVEPATDSCGANGAVDPGLDQPLLASTADTNAAEDDPILESDDDEEEAVQVATSLVTGWLASAKGAGGAVGGHAKYIMQNIKERRGVGLDLYTVYLAVDFVSLIYVAIAYYGLVGRATGSFIDSVQQDLLPGPLVVFLLLMVCIMIADRVVYIMDSPVAKFALHLGLAFGYHIAYVYWRFNIASEATAVGAGLFFVKAIYLYVSCNQIRIGFALHRRHDPFTVGVSGLHWFGNLIYRSIPFLFELRVLLDWTCGRTSLKLNAWFTIEDIHRELYDRFYDIMHTEWTNPVRGTKYPFLVKSYQGVLNFVLIIVVLFFPLMYYSTFNPNLQPNRVSSLRLEVSFGTYSSFYSAMASDPDLPSNFAVALARTRPTLDRQGITEQFKESQLLEFSACSSRVWGVSPQARHFVLEAINRSLVNGTRFVVATAIELSRVGATSGSAKEITMRGELELEELTLRRLYNAIALSEVYNTTVTPEDPAVPGTAPTTEAPVANGTSAPPEPPEPFDPTTPVPLGALFDPFVFNQPSGVETLTTAVGGSVEGNMATCALVLASNETTGGASSGETWCIRCNPLFVGGNTPTGDASEYPATGCIDGNRMCTGRDNYETSPVSGQFDTGPYVVAISDPVPQDSNFLPNVGIIALYTTFILTLWTIIRGKVTGYSHRIVMQQLAHPQPVAELVSYIYLVRSVGDPKDDLELEELLYFELLDLIRGPDTMLHKTGLRMDDYDADGKFAPSYAINL